MKEIASHGAGIKTAKGKNVAVFHDKDNDKPEEKKINSTESKKSSLKKTERRYSGATGRFPYNKLTPKQMERFYDIAPLGHLTRRNSFPLKDLSLEQQDMWLYPEEKHKKIAQVISVNPLMKEKYASIESSARRTEKFEADFPMLFQHAGNENVQAILTDLQNKHTLHMQNNLSAGKNTLKLPSKRKWRVTERDLDGMNFFGNNFSLPIHPRKLNLDILHQHLVADDGANIGFTKDEEKGVIGKDAFLNRMRDSKEFEGVSLHDTYLNAAINILKPKYAAGEYGLLTNNCQDFIDDVINLGDEIANIYGESIFLENDN